MKTRSIIRTTCLAGMLAVSGLSYGDTIGFDLGIGNPGISGYTGPYAHVVVNLTSGTTATITFTSLTAGGDIYLLGDGGSVAVNVNASSWTLGAITGANSGTGFSRTDSDYSNGGSGNEDGFGSFNQTINTFDGYKHSSDMISFTLTDTGGTWVNAADVLTGNGPGGAGNVAAAHIFVTSSPAKGSNGALATGYASGDENGGGTPPVPDGGSTVALLGFAVLGLGSLRRLISRN